MSICSEDPMPPQSVIFQWLHRHPEFVENYARARQFWADAEFERMMNIADTPQLSEKTEISDGKLKVITGDMIDHRRLQVETRKWALARQAPKKYGDATLLKHGDAEGNILKVQISQVTGTDE